MNDLKSASFLNLFNHPIFVIDKNYHVIAVNQAGISFTQTEENKFATRTCHQLIYQRESPCAYCPIKDLKTKDTQSKVISFHSKSYQINFHANQSEGKEYFIEDIQDITKEKEERENEIRIFNLASIGTLISGIAHELNNPITGMNLNLQNLIANLDSYKMQSIRQKLRLMQEDVYRSLKIIGDILSITSPQRARFITTNFRQTIDRSIATIKRLYPELSRRIHWEIDGLSVQFAYQSEKMERLFSNLFRNSLQKYDYKEGTIKISWFIQNKICYITVADQAGGIDEETIKKLFLPFERQSSKKEGSGLGLTVCLRIVQEHYGKLLVETKDGCTIFKIELPIDLF